MFYISHLDKQFIWNWFKVAIGFHFFIYRYLTDQQVLMTELSFPCCLPRHTCHKSSVILYGSLSGLLIQFHFPICVFLHQYYTDLITTTLLQVLASFRHLWICLEYSWYFTLPYQFQREFVKLHTLSHTPHPAEMLFGIVLNLEINLKRTDTFTVLKLPIQGHGVYIYQFIVTSLNNALEFSV